MKYILLTFAALTFAALSIASQIPHVGIIVYFALHIAVMIIATVYFQL